MPFIKRDFIENLPSKVDIITTIGKRITLTKRGRDYKACCPFHQEKTPSFSVSSEKQAYHCFGCGEGGYAIDFIKKFDNLDFIEAVERLAEENNILVEYDTKAKPIDKSINELKIINEQVNEFYQQQLRHSTFKQQVVDYAQHRGISGKIAQRFNLGFAPNGWDNLYQHFKNSDRDIKNLAKLGLIVAKSSENNTNIGYYDRFRARLMFPIYNHKSEIIGFGGRVLSPDDKPKYLNSSQSPLFDKSLELYGLNLARKYTRNIDYLLVVEGYMDVVALHESGITSCVATLGTTTTTHHLKTLSRSTHTIVFCFDGDNAGFSAAVKALKLSLPLINVDIRIKFLFLPSGEDPDSLVKKIGKTKFEEKIKNATTLSEFLFSYLKKDLDMTSVEGKTEFLQQTGVLINQVQYTIYKEQLLQGLANEVGQNLEFVQKIISQKQQSVREKPTITTKLQYTNAIRDQSTKNHLRKITTLVLQHPTLATDNLNTIIKKIPGTDILQKIIDIAEFEEAETHTLIETFKQRPKIYNRLWFFVKSSITFTEDESKKELEATVNLLLKSIKKQKVQVDIFKSNDYSSAKQEEINKQLIQRKN